MSRLYRWQQFEFGGLQLRFRHLFRPCTFRMNCPIIYVHGLSMLRFYHGHTITPCGCDSFAHIHHVFVCFFFHLHSDCDIVAGPVR